MKIKKAIIPAAGLGTRMLPATKALPKEMLPIFDKPTLQYIVEEALDSGIEEILVITGRNKQSIEDHFDRSIEVEMELEKLGKYQLLDLMRRISYLANIHYIRQKEPKGLGHAIYCARSFIGNEPFAILLGDDVIHAETPCLKQLVDVYEQHHVPVLGIQRVPEQEVDKYGIVNGNKIAERLYQVSFLEEKPRVETATSNLAILGRYIVTNEIFDILENTKPGKDNEIQLTDALNTLLTQKNIMAYDFLGYRYDVGNKFGMLKAGIEFGLRDKRYRDGIIAYLETLHQSDYQVY